MSIESELQGIFQDVFDDETIELTEEMNADSIEDWDSLAQIRLIVAIEKHFKLKFTLDEVQGLKNVGEMIALIQKKQVKV